MNNKASNIRSAALIVLSAVLLVLSFPGYNYYFLAWFAFVPLFFAIENQKASGAFRLTYLAGVIFFLGTVYWLMHVTLPGMVVVVLYLALYIGLFGLLITPRLRKNCYKTLFFIPSAWVAVELVRSHFLTGFGWNLLGYSQAPFRPIIQIADITGAYGVSFLMVLVNIAIFFTIKDIRKKNNNFTYLALAVFIVYLAITYGTYRLKNIFTGERLRVAVIQGNIPQKHKWDSKFREEIITKYLNLTKKASSEKPDLIIWPESSVPGLLESERDLFAAVKGLAVELKVPILVGTPREDPVFRDVYYNSAVLFDEGGRIVDRYNKIHLVPFGEYVPLRSALSFVDNFAPSPIGDFTPGDNYTVFRFFTERAVTDMNLSWKLVKKVGFSCLICFEDVFPDLSREFVKRGASFLVNITNDAWYERTSATYQHNQNLIFRAVENRVNAVRAANTGLSCFIDQKGEIVDRVESNGEYIFIDGYKTKDITLTRARTFYMVFGDVFAYGCLIYTILYIILERRKKWSI